MDLRFSADELAFRNELRAFFADNLPQDIRERMRLGRLQLAQGVWRTRLDAGAAHDLS